MILQLQAISRIVDGKDYSFIEDNNLRREMFGDFAEVFDYIVEHYQKYKVIPEDATLLEKFPYLEFKEVNGYAYPKVLTLSNDSHFIIDGLPTKYENRILF